MLLLTLNAQNPLTTIDLGEELILSCRMRQYFDLSTDEMKYLSKLEVASQKVNWKLCCNITKTHHTVTLRKRLQSLLMPLIEDPILSKTVSVF